MESEPRPGPVPGLGPVQLRGSPCALGWGDRDVAQELSRDSNPGRPVVKLSCTERCLETSSASVKDNRENQQVTIYPESI